MEEIKHSIDNEELEQTSTHKTRSYLGHRFVWHLRHKIPKPNKIKIQRARPYLIEQIYNNGSVNVTTLQGKQLGRVNMKKLKPYQEPKTSQAYALQNLACHILEAKLRQNNFNYIKKITPPKLP